MAESTHEGAHAIQSDTFSLAADGETVGRPRDAAERDASTAAHAVMTGISAPAPSAPATPVSLFLTKVLGPLRNTVTAGALSGELGAAGIGGAGGSGLAAACAEGGIFAGGFLGPLAVLAASGLVGYGIGALGVRKSDEIFKRRGYFHDDYDNPQSGTSEAADWGRTLNPMKWF